MKILLVGGNRYVGVEIIWHLLGAGHEVTVLALDAPPADLRAHVRLLLANRNDEAALATLFGHEHFDVAIDNIAYEPQQVVSLTGALQGRVGRYLLTSTTDTYPHNMPRDYTEEQTEIREYDMASLAEGDRYNYGKRSCEAVLIKSGLPWTVLRPCIVTGPRDNIHGAPAMRGTHWFEESARSHFWPQRILDGGPLLMASEDEYVMKMVWIGDLARAYTHAIAHPESTTGQAFNVAGDEVWTNERIVRALAAAAGVAPEIVRVPAAVIEQAGLDYAPVYGTAAYWPLADNAKLKSTGWKPTPAEQWLPFLLEADSAPISRAWYGTRMQEIALARHVQRKQGEVVVIPAAMEVQADRARPEHAASTASIAGRHEAQASLAWQARAMEQGSGSLPLPEFFKTFRGATVSGIGVGTWMGDLSAATDARYVETLVHAASRGLNVFDTAINYRHMLAERCVGQAVQRLAKCGIPRQALLVASKGGYITHDAAGVRDWNAYVREEYLEPGLISAEEMSRAHAINPQFIRRQVEQSLDNLKLETLDIYYLHNPEEALAGLAAKELRRSMTMTFAVLEEAVATGRIGSYGLATWDGLRVVKDDPRHLSLATAVAAARDAAGSDEHHLAVIQLPFNIRDHQAATLPTQKLGRATVPALQAAEALGLYVMTSASVMQGGETAAADEARLRAAAPGHSLITAALQISRSGRGVGTALVGMRRIHSVEEAMAVAQMPLAQEGA
ncbi:MAG: aldo/keto reductase [Sulfuritalea sp.]|nr:aldo/keto reductase [Sulfuritalea sp.]